MYGLKIEREKTCAVKKGEYASRASGKISLARTRIYFRVEIGVRSPALESYGVAAGEFFEAGLARKGERGVHSPISLL